MPKGGVKRGTRKTMSIGPLPSPGRMIAPKPGTFQTQCSDVGWGVGQLRGWMSVVRKGMKRLPVVLALDALPVLVITLAVEPKGPQAAGPLGGEGLFLYDS